MRESRLTFVAALIVAGLLSACSEPQAPSKASQPPPPSAAPLTPTPTAPTTLTLANATLIRDGVGVGGVELGMTVADVQTRLGPPVRTNKDGTKILYMAFHASEIFDVYFGDTGRVRMIIAAVKDGTWCTDYGVCLYREGDLAKLKAHYGAKLLRFVDRDGSVTYRLLEAKGDSQVMTEYTPAEAKNGVVQVAMLYWTGPIDRSSFD